MKLDVLTVGTATRDVFLISKDFAAYEQDDENYLVLPGATKIDLPDIANDIGGGAPNAAVTFARTGLKTGCLAKVGVDGPGREIETTIENEGIKSLLVKDRSHQTGLSVILKGPNGEDTMFIHRGAGYEYKPKDFDFAKIRAHWVYITSLGGDLMMLNRVVNWAAREGIRIAVNPGALEIAKPQRLLRILRKVDVVLMNHTEAAQLFGTRDQDQIFQKARAKGLHTVVVTDSKHGAHMLDGSYIYSSGIYRDVAVVDRTGAGYAYGAGLIAAIAHGRSIQQAMSYAAANATSVISYLGARVGILANMDVDIMKVSIRVFHEEDHEASH